MCLKAGRTNNQPGVVASYFINCVRNVDLFDPHHVSTADGERISEIEKALIDF